MFVEEQIDRALVELSQRQTFLAHPPRQMGNTSEILTAGVGGVATLCQTLHKRVDLWRKNAVEQPCLGLGVERSDQVHDGLLE
jgi:hypothetical protein